MNTRCVITFVVFVVMAVVSVSGCNSKKTKVAEANGADSHVQVAPPTSADGGGEGHAAREAVDRGDYALAMTICNRELAKNSSDVEWLQMRGGVYFKAGKPNEAIADFSEAMRLCPEYGNAYIARSAVWCHLGQFDKALSDAERGIQLKPDSTDAYYNRGNARSKRGEFDAAISDFNQALRLDPTLVGALTNRAGVYMKLGGFEDGPFATKALDDLNEVLRLSPSHINARTDRAIIWMLKGDWDAAISDANAALRVDTSNKRALQILELAKTRGKSSIAR